MTKRNGHNKCEALVVTCIDFRFREQLHGLLEEEIGGDFDHKADAGGVKALLSGAPAVREWILENIAIAVRLHEIKKVLLINHRDCGAYGGDSAFADNQAQRDHHRGELESARVIILGRFPELEVHTFFAELDGEKVELLPMTIN